MKANKFTIIIPTRERANTLQYCLKTCVAQSYENFEIIVSDNFSSDNTKQVVDSFSDKRVRYINTGKRLSMPKNYEFALSHVTEGWVCIIGDDDGLLPDSITKANKIVNEQTNADVLFWYHIAPRYFWAEEFGGTKLDNRFLFRKMEDWSTFVPKERALKMMSFDSSYESLPIIYHGFVSIELITAIKKASVNGLFFQSRIPDLYSTIPLSFFAKNVVQCAEPLSIQGISNYSIGESRTFKKNNNKAEKQFLTEFNIPFHPALKLSPDDNPMSNINILSTDAFLYFFDTVQSEYSDEKENYKEYVLLQLTKKIKKQNNPAFIHLVEKILTQNNLQAAKLTQNKIYLKLNKIKKYFYYTYSHKISCDKYGAKTIDDIFKIYDKLILFSLFDKIEYTIKKQFKFAKRYVKFLLKKIFFYRC